MSGVSNYLDPIEAAQDEIRRSKRAVASALDDLSQHHSWLEGYHRDERRRAQRLRRQETLQALEHRRQRAAWIAQRFARTSFVTGWTTAIFLARNGAAILAWGLSRARALAFLLARETSAAIDWSWRTGRIRAQKGYQGAAIGFAWAVRTSDALGMAVRKRLSTDSVRLYAAAATRAQPILEPALEQAVRGWSRAQFRSRRLAVTLQRGLTNAWSRTRHELPILTRKGGESVVDGFAWSVRSSDALGIAVRTRLSTDAGRLYAAAATRAQPILEPALEQAGRGWGRAEFRSKRLALTLQRGLTNAWSQTRHELPILTRKGGESVVDGFAWTVRTSDALGIAVRKRLSTDAGRLYAAAATRAQPSLQPALEKASTAWSRARSRAKRLAHTLHRRASDSWSRPRSSVTLLARDAVMATSQGRAKLAEKAMTIKVLGRKRLAILFGRTQAGWQYFTRAAAQVASKSWSQAARRSRTVLDTCSPQHRALVVRQCTALVCIEPRRDRLPVIRAG